VPVLALSLVSLFLLATLLFDFVNNPDRLTNPFAILVNSLTMKYAPVRVRAYGALMIFVFTWLLFGVVGLSEYDREGVFPAGPRPALAGVIGLYAGSTVLGGAIFGLLLAGHLAWLPTIEVASFADVVRVAEALGGLLGRYYGLTAGMLVALGWVLSYGHDLRPLRGKTGLLTVAVGLVLLFVAGYAVKRGCYDLILADTIFKQGSSFANASTVNEKYVGISHYEKSLEYAPREDYYMLFLGKAYLELAQGLPAETSQEERGQVFAETERILARALAVNPLNTDHSANLARFYKSWAARLAIDASGAELSDAARSELDVQRQELLTLSLANYRTALTLSPNNPILWNELAQLYATDLLDDLSFRETISRSLEVDREFEETWMLLGDIRSSQGDIDGAVQAYLQSLEIRDNCTVRRVIGTLWAQQGRWQESSDFLDDAARRPVCLSSPELWELYRVLSIALGNQARVPEALEAAYQARDLVPAAQLNVVEELITQLEGQALPAEPTGEVTP